MKIINTFNLEQFIKNNINKFSPDYSYINDKMSNFYFKIKNEEVTGNVHQNIVDVYKSDGSTYIKIFYYLPKDKKRFTEFFKSL